MDRLRLWTTTLLLMLTLTTGGCASTLNWTEEEKERKEDKRQIAEANWYNCEAIYKREGIPTQHRHVHDSYKRLSRTDVWDDLYINQCRAILGDEWLEYGDE